MIWLIFWMNYIYMYPRPPAPRAMILSAEDGGTRTVDVTTSHFSHILLGGDQLTVARVRGSQGALLNSDSGIERVEGFVPVIEDWHTKMCYMKVCSTCLMVCNVYTSI